MIFTKSFTPSMPTISIARFASSSAANTPYTTPSSSTYIIGPGVMPFMMNAPNSTAVTESPGTPSDSSGIIAPPEQPLFALSVAATPSGIPVPNFSGYFDVFFETP